MSVPSSSATAAQTAAKISPRFSITPEATGALAAGAGALVFFVSHLPRTLSQISVISFTRPMMQARPINTTPTPITQTISGCISPAVPVGQSILRTSYTATHTHEQLDKAINAIAETMEELDKIMPLEA